MYLNVKVPAKDGAELRILQWLDDDISKAPLEYQAAIHIYRTKSSGFIANLCVHGLAKRTEDSLLSDILTKDLYVGDHASSVQYEGEAVSLVTGLCFIE